MAMVRCGRMAVLLAPPGTFLVLRKVCLITHGRRGAKTQPHHASAARSKKSNFKFEK